MAQSIRIDSDDHNALKALTEETKRPMRELMSIAIADLKRKFMLEATNNGYRQLQSNAEAWTAELAERASWDSAVVTDADKDDWQ